MNITDYLLLPEQAKWAKEKGFDGECYGTFYPSNKMYVVGVKKDNKWMRRGAHSDKWTALTFDQFFDWVEEKWHIETRIVRELQSDEPAYYFTLLFDDTFEVYNSAPIYKTKRSARIAACEAIIDYINKLIADAIEVQNILNKNP